MKVIVKEDLCIGCGLCESVCPNVFEMQDSIAKVKVSEVPAGDAKCAEKSIKDCPVEAIISKD